VSKPVAAASSAGYKVVLKFVAGKYTLSGHMLDDAPFSVALTSPKLLVLSQIGKIMVG
jgi:hypothetical protein